MAYQSCPDCGTRTYNSACPNCHEETFIMQNQFEDMATPVSDEFVAKVQEQKEVIKQRQEFCLETHPKSTDPLDRKDGESERGNK